MICSYCDKEILENDKTTTIGVGSRVISIYHSDCFIDEIFQKAMSEGWNKPK